MTIVRLTASFTAAALTAGLATAASAQTTITFADYGPNRGDRAATVQDFFSDIKARTGGEVDIVEHWGGALLGAKNGFKGLQSGVADMSTITATYAPQDLFGYRVGDLPIAVDDEVAQSMALYELATTNEGIIAQFDKAGVKYIANYTVGPIQMICNGVDLESFEDLKGKKVRYTGEYGKIFDDLGVTTVSLATPEIYQGLSTGLVDCAQTYAYTTLSYKQVEVSDQFVIVNLGTLGGNGIFMNKKSFERLSPEVQEAIVAAGKALTEHNARTIKAANQKAIDVFSEGVEGRNLKVTTMGEEDRQMIADASQKYIDAWIDEASDYGLDGKAIVDEYLALIEKNSM